LPNADLGAAGPPATAAHLRLVFNRMGFNDQEIVALSGAHSMGACHRERSGFWGPWTRAPTTVSNEYFRELVENKWTIKTTHKGKPWDGPIQFEDPTGDLMMLPTDIVLIQDAEFRKYVEAYAKDQDLFFKDFKAAFEKLMNLGFAGAPKKWFGLF
jgi:cytochrome c peroxidase